MIKDINNPIVNIISDPTIFKYPVLGLIVKAIKHNKWYIPNTKKINLNAVDFNKFFILFKF